jgi:hypothetical protein
VPVRASSASTVVACLTIAAGVAVVVGVAASPLKVNVIADFCKDIRWNKVVLN